ncbi:MAG: metallophosphoesterase [Anaerolineae bacterium]
MSRFGEKWINHTERMAIAWRQLVAPTDVMLLPGDISWAQTTPKILPDLAWLSTLPGRKVLVRGNHDHWWDDIRKARQLCQNFGFFALEGDSITLDDVIVCGAMGHLAPHDPYFKPDPKKDRYTRELLRLEAALQHARTARLGTTMPILLMMHYPPFTSDGQSSGFVEVITRYHPDVCLYGHLHHSAEWSKAKIGDHAGVRYQLVAADFLDMTPYLVWDTHA